MERIIRTMFTLRRTFPNDYMNEESPLLKSDLIALMEGIIHDLKNGDNVGIKIEYSHYDRLTYHEVNTREEES